VASPAISTDVLKALTRLPQPGTIVVLGHIDHGKTTLVSAISKVSERYGVGKQYTFGSLNPTRAGDVQRQIGGGTPARLYYGSAIP